MRASHLLSLLFLPAFLSANEAEMNDMNLDVAAACHRSSDSSHHHSKHHKETVFASFRNNEDITVPAGGHVLFNVENANKGDGVRYHDGIFTIEKSGFYLINYGLASIGTAGTTGEAFGFNLVKTRHGFQTIVDSVLTNGSSAIVLYLKEHDTVAVVSQRFQVRLIAGSLPPRTTSLTDTAFISFLRVGC